MKFLDWLFGRKTVESYRDRVDAVITLGDKDIHCSIVEVNVETLF